MYLFSLVWHKFERFSTNIWKAGNFVAAGYLAKSHKTRKGFTLIGAKRCWSSTMKVVYDIVTENETWLYCYNQKKTKVLWMRHQTNEVANCEAKTVDKSIIVFFFTKKCGCTMRLEKQRTVNVVRYTTICPLRVLEKLFDRRPRSRIFLSDKSIIVSWEGGACDPSVHSVDVAFCDFFLFPKIKDLMRGLTFTDLEVAV